VASRRAPDPEAVFNGIAYDPATGHFFVTGELWPDLFEIEILGG
jgi:glutamine cyclotransferase